MIPASRALKSTTGCAMGRSCVHGSARAPQRGHRRTLTSRGSRVSQTGQVRSRGLSFGFMATAILGRACLSHIQPHSGRGCKGQVAAGRQPAISYRLSVTSGRWTVDSGQWTGKRGGTTDDGSWAGVASCPSHEWPSPAHRCGSTAVLCCRRLHSIRRFVTRGRGGACGGRGLLVSAKTRTSR